MMDGLYLKAGLMPAPITVSDVRTNITSVRKRYAPPWGFSFKYPLRSLWGGKRFDAIAVDDAVSVENEEKSGGNWVLKIFKFRSLRRDLEKCGEMEVESGEEERNECVGDDECEVCNEEGVVDKESFGKMLRRVTLGEARLYAQISYLGSLAYSIPQIKVSLLFSGFYVDYLWLDYESRLHFVGRKVFYERIRVFGLFGFVLFYILFLKGLCVL